MTNAAGSPVSTLLIGYGLGGRVFHAPLVATTPGMSLDGIVTSDPDRRRQAREAHPAAAVYSSAKDAWLAGHDLAVVSTANVTHVPYASAAIGHGLHVVVDKPIAPTADDARGLAAQAEASGVHLIPFQNRRWDSDYLTALAVAASGALGRVHRFESRLERMRVTPKPGWRNSTDPADMGGMLYDLGAHVVDQAIRLMGPVEKVMAILRSVRVPGAVDDDVLVALEHGSGALSLLTVSQVGAFGQPRMTLNGTHGGLRIDASDSQEAALVAGRRPSDAGGWGVEPPGTDAVLRTFDDGPAERAVPLVPGTWPEFYRGVESTLRTGAPPPVLVTDVVENLRVLDAARESASTGRTVRLDPPAGHR